MVGRIGEKMLTTGVTMHNALNYICYCMVTRVNIGTIVTIVMIVIPRNHKTHIVTMRIIAVKRMQAIQRNL